MSFINESLDLSY